MDAAPAGWLPSVRLGSCGLCRKVSCLLCSPRCALGRPVPGLAGTRPRRSPSPKPEAAAAGCAQVRPSHTAFLDSPPRGQGGLGGDAGRQRPASAPPQGVWCVVRPLRPQGSAWVCVLGLLRVPASHSSHPGRQQGSSVWVPQPRVAPGFGLASPGHCGHLWSELAGGGSVCVLQMNSENKSVAAKTAMALVLG